MRVTKTIITFTMLILLLCVVQNKKYKSKWKKIQCTLEQKNTKFENGWKIKFEGGGVGWVEVTKENSFCLKVSSRINNFLYCRRQAKKITKDSGLTAPEIQRRKALHFLVIYVIKVVYSINNDVTKKLSKTDIRLLYEPLTMSCTLPLGCTNETLKECLSGIG